MAIKYPKNIIEKTVLRSNVEKICENQKRAIHIYVKEAHQTAKIPEKVSDLSLLTSPDRWYW